MMEWASDWVFEVFGVLGVLILIGVWTIIEELRAIRRILAERLPPRQWE